MIVELKRESDQLKAEIRENRAIATQTQSGVNSLRTDLDRLRRAVADCGKEIQRDRSRNTGIRIQMSRDKEELRTRMDEMAKEHRMQLDELRAEMRSQLDGIRELLLARPAGPAQS